MTLCSLRQAGFRNLEDTELSFSPGLNVIYGPNGAGKTSFLESVFYLSRARSFRARRPAEVISGTSDRFWLFAQIETGPGATTVGMERDRQQIRIRVGGEDCRETGRLSQILPLQVLTTESHEIVTGGPSARRRFMDWGVFHVEHGFLGEWRRYVRALKQRNTALREKSSSEIISSWNQVLISSAEEIHRYRGGFHEAFEQVFPVEAGRLLPKIPVRVSYRRGWDVDTSFAELLLGQLDGDRRVGYTRQGPHRADLTIEADGRSAREWLSRGQQRQLVIAMLFAESRVLAEHEGHPGVFLLDDIAAELDPGNRQRVLSGLADLGAQSFVTVIDPADIDLSQHPDARVFHVEHGQIKVVV